MLLVIIDPLLLQQPVKHQIPSSHYQVATENIWRVDLKFCFIQSNQKRIPMPSSHLQRKVILSELLVRIEKEYVFVDKNSSELHKHRVYLVVLVLLTEPIFTNFSTSYFCDQIYSVDRNIYVFRKQHVPIFPCRLKLTEYDDQKYLKRIPTIGNSSLCAYLLGYRNHNVP